jgi:hypothetical protein
MDFQEYSKSYMFKNGISMGGKLNKLKKGLKDQNRHVQRLLHSINSK